MNEPLRVYLVGAHSTGKTTLASWVRDHYGLPMISEVARGVLAEMEAQLDQIRSNLDVVNRYQGEVFERQLRAEEEQEGGFVSDRAFCNLAYAAQHSLILPDLFQDRRLRAYMDSVSRGVVYFLRPHRELLAEDGVREAASWEAVLRIDGMVKLMLEMFGIPYIPVDCLSMQERVRLVERTLQLAGVEPVKELQPQVAEEDRWGHRGPTESEDRIASVPSAAPAGNGNGNGNGRRSANGNAAPTRT